MDNRTALYAMQFYMNKGYSPVAAAGIVGNLDHESNLNPNGKPGDGGLANGIAQWHPDRWNRMVQWSTAHGMNPRSLDAQLGFVDVELRSMPAAYAAVANAKTVREAAGEFGLKFERPLGAQTGVAENLHGWGSRLGRAVNFASLATGKPMAEFAASGWTPPQGAPAGGPIAGMSGDSSFDMGPAPDDQLPQPAAMEAPGGADAGGFGGGSDMSDLMDYTGGADMGSPLGDAVSDKYAQTAAYRKLGVKQAPTEMALADVFQPQNVALQKIGAAKDAPGMRKMSVG